MTGAVRSHNSLDTEHISPCLGQLLEAWLVSRGRKMCGRGHWPEVAYHRVTRGLVTAVEPAFMLARGTAPRRDTDVDEVGWAYLSMTRWEQDLLLLDTILTERAEWAKILTAYSISTRGLRRVWVRLQRLCRQRGVRL